MLLLYKYHLDCGRMGFLEGIFVAESKEIQGAMGKTLVFGEALGKNSDIVATLEEDNLEILTDDISFINKFKSLKCESGYNPLDFIKQNE